MKMLTVYSKKNCPACVSTEALLMKYMVPFECVKIDEDDEAKQLILSRGFRTVPQIFLGDDVFVQGGWLGLKEMSEQQVKELLYGKA